MKNIGDAFSFAFKDPNWVSKFIVGAVFTLLSMLLIGIPILYGYYIELLQRVRRREQNPLPEWTDIGVKFVSGFKYIVALIIYYLPIIVVSLPVIMMLFISAFLTGVHEAEIIGSAVLMVFIVVIIIPYSFAVTLLQPIISVQYAERESIGDALRVGTVLKLFKHHWQDSLVAVLISLGIGLLASIGIIFIIIGILFTSLYANLVTFHLYGQIAQAIDETPSFSGTVNV